jgi:hypothetical protein
VRSKSQIFNIFPLALSTFLIVKSTMSWMICIALLAACESARGNYEQKRTRRKLPWTPGEITRPNGDPSCPCLPLDQVPADKPVAAFNLGELPIDYGVGCDVHEISTPICANAPRCDTTAPLVECDLNWCELPNCYVDPDNCHLQHQSSSYFPGRYYSCEFNPKWQ